MRKSLLYKANASLKKYHTYGVNASARYLVEIKSISELKEVLQFSKEKSLIYVLIGRGSNILFRDDYYDGIVIINKMKDVQIEDDIVTVSSGVNIPLLARRVCKLGLSGFQDLVGVPGTVGGCVYMNAGTAVNEISRFLTSVDVLDIDGEIKTLTKNECGFSYRSSKFHGTDDIILEATFKLEKNSEAYSELEKHLKARLDTQPIDKKNSGCIFKNPVGQSAGRLIDSCGLKGLKVGGAIVSMKHANFIDNADNASYKDIVNLIALVKESIKKETEVELEYEVRII